MTDIMLIGFLTFGLFIGISIGIWFMIIEIIAFKLNGGDKNKHTENNNKICDQENKKEN